MPRPALATKSESPKTATRASGFGVSGSVGLGALGAIADTAAAIEIGPDLSPLLASSFTSPVVSRLLMSLSAQLCGLVSTNVIATRPLTPPFTATADLAKGNAVRKPKLLVIGCAG